MSRVRIPSPAPISALRKNMSNRFFPLFLALSSVFCAGAQNYKVEPISTAAPGVSGAMASAIQSQGSRIAGPSGVWCEVWPAKSIPVAGKPSDGSVALGIAQGTLLGVLRFPAKGADRRDQVIPAGV